MPKITEIIDGDSIVVEGMKVRVANVDVSRRNREAVAFLRREWLGKDVVLGDDPKQGAKVVHGEVVKLVFYGNRSLTDELLKYGKRLKF